METTEAGFLDDLLSLFGYPVGSGQSLVDGSLRMRYCSCKKPTWRLPHSGGVAALVYAASLHPLLFIRLVLGILLVLETLETVKE